MNSRSLLFALGVVLGGLVQASPASAHTTVVYVRPAVRQPYSHTGGFFGRFQLGPAYSYTSYPDADLEWSGGALDLSLSLGFSLPSSLALHVDFLGDVAWEPTVYYGGNDIGTLDETSYAASGIGFGLSYYFPRNGFVTGGLGFAGATLANDYEEVNSDVGGYLTFGGGKEWWVLPRLGVGLFARLTFYRLPDSEFESSFTTVVPSFGFSMTVD